MGKALGPILIGAVIIGAAFLTGGASLVPTLAANASLEGAAILTTGIALSTTALGSMALAIGAGALLSGVTQAFAKTPTISAATIDRLNASLVPSTARIMAFGQTALATDIRYVEPSGTNQEYIDYIIAVASHKVTSIDEIWMEDALAWTAASGVQGIYAGYLTVSTILEGGAGAYHTVNSGTLWGASQRLTGCASMHLRIKRSGTASPFTSGLSGRMTVRGKGIPVYDPRKDSTVAGGSGSMRANDQTTWAYTSGAELGQNLALQSLTCLLGWRIGGKVAVGRGIPPARLNLVGWITAANLCDETVTTSTGSQPRYHGAGLVSEADAPTAALQNFATTCNGRFREATGQLGLAVMHNDLAGAATDPGLTDDDVIGAFVWNPDPSLEQCFNVVRGRFTDPSNASLYQLVDYPEVRLTSLDGIDRILQLDLPWVQDAAMAQRLAKQTLERKQYQRSFSAPFGERAAQYSVGDIVPFTFSPLAFNRHLFRVDTAPVSFNGVYNMVLVEEADAIYAWDSDDRAPVTAATPTTYNPLNDPLLVAITASRVVYRGAWASGTGYEFGDSVTSGGSTYRCVLAHTSGSGNAPPNATYWALVALAGTPGSPGSPGGPGSAGYNNVVVRIFKRSATTPALPSASSTYDFTTGVLSGLNNGWSTSVPAADGNPLYESTAPAVSTTSTYSIAAASWAGTIISNGGGNQTAEVTIYIRASSTPALPSASTTYTFSTGILTGLNNGWSTSPPAYSAGTDLYFSDATALSTGATDTIPASEWEAPQIMAKDGAHGSGGGTAPATPFTGTAPGSTINAPNSIAVAPGQSVTIQAVFQANYVSGPGSATIRAAISYSINGGSATTSNNDRLVTSASPTDFDYSVSYTNSGSTTVSISASLALTRISGTATVSLDTGLLTIR